MIDTLLTHSAIAKLSQDLEALVQENLALRRALAILTASGTVYWDDGEMSDSSTLPFIDYLLDSPDEILIKVSRRKEEA